MNDQQEREMFKDMPNPLQTDLDDPLFESIWQAIKSWDVNVPAHYAGYCGANGSHVMLILSQLRTALAANVPAGWKLVPVEPTPEMLRAEPPGGFEMSFQRRPEVWAAMLAAAPEAATPAQAQQAKPLTQAQRIRLWDNCPEVHGDVVGRDAFERLVKLVESVHRIGASSEGDKQ